MLVQSSAGDHCICVCQCTNTVKTIIVPVVGICNIAGIVIEVDVAVGCRGGWMAVCVEFVNRVVAKANKANVCGD